jgi:hypothetical protein
MGILVKKNAAKGGEMEDMEARILGKFLPK